MRYNSVVVKPSLSCDKASRALIRAWVNDASPGIFVVSFAPEAPRNSKFLVDTALREDEPTSRPAKQIQAELLECGILTGTASDTHVLRLLPPFILEEEHVDMLRDALADLPA